MRTALFACVLAAAALVATSATAFPIGANSNSNLRRATAVEVMRDSGRLVEPREIVIVERSGGTVNVFWQADTPNGRYVCNADDMLRRVSCAHIVLREELTAEIASEE